MDYYEAKRKAYLLIDEMLKEGKDFTQIKFKIATLFGFGEKIIKDRLKMLKDNGLTK